MTVSMTRSSDGMSRRPSGQVSARSSGKKAARSASKGRRRADDLAVTQRQTAPRKRVTPKPDATTSQRVAKISVSVPLPLLQFADRWAERNNATRSAAIVAALKALREVELVGDSEAAITEWATSGEGALWDVTVSDGLIAG